MKPVPDERHADLPPVGISACLLGEAVRHDGGDRRADDLRAAFDGRVRWVPFCPEVLAGFGVPRPPIEIVAQAGAPRVLEVRSRRDRTAPLMRAAGEVLVRLRAAGVRGVVVKARSPSCGLDDAPRVGGEPGDGLVTATIRAVFGVLPVASEVQLATPEAREAFLAQVHAT